MLLLLRRNALALLILLLGVPCKPIKLLRCLTPYLFAFGCCLATLSLYFFSRFFHALFSFALELFGTFLGGLGVDVGGGDIGEGADGAGIVGDGWGLGSTAGRSQS